MKWDKEYENLNRIWGDRPSELAKITFEYLKNNNLVKRNLEILDIGCGYGRDAFYLHREMGCSVTGIDNSSKAIEMARSHFPATDCKKVDFLCESFLGIRKKLYDILFVSTFHISYKGHRSNGVDIPGCCGG